MEEYNNFIEKDILDIIQKSIFSHSKIQICINNFYFSKETFKNQKITPLKAIENNLNYCATLNFDLCIKYRNNVTKIFSKYIYIPILVGSQICNLPKTKKKNITELYFIISGEEFFFEKVNFNFINFLNFSFKKFWEVFNKIFNDSYADQKSIDDYFDFQKDKLLNLVTLLKPPKFFTIGIFDELLEACKKEDLLLIKTLIKQNLCPNNHNNYKSPLTIAFEKNNYKMIDILLENGADPNSKLVYGSKEITLFKYSCLKNNFELVKRLVLSKKFNSKEEKKEVLQIVLNNENFKLLQFLLTYNSSAKKICFFFLHLKYKPESNYVNFTIKPRFENLLCQFRNDFKLT